MFADTEVTIWNAVIAAVVTIILAWMQQRAIIRADKVRQEILRAGSVTRNKLDDIAEVGKAVHALVNSAMGEQLRVTMIALSRIAQITKDAQDIEAAAAAEVQYKEHQAKQSIVDAGKTT